MIIANHAEQLARYIRRNFIGFNLLKTVGNVDETYDFFLFSGLRFSASCGRTGNVKIAWLFPQEWTFWDGEGNICDDARSVPGSVRPGWYNGQTDVVHLTPNNVQVYSPLEWIGTFNPEVYSLDSDERGGGSPYRIVVNVNDGPINCDLSTLVVLSDRVQVTTRPLNAAAIGGGRTVVRLGFCQQEPFIIFNGVITANNLNAAGCLELSITLNRAMRNSLIDGHKTYTYHKTTELIDVRNTAVSRELANVMESSLNFFHWVINHAALTDSDWQREIDSVPRVINLTAAAIAMPLLLPYNRPGLKRQILSKILMRLAEIERTPVTQRSIALFQEQITLMQAMQAYKASTADQTLECNICGTTQSVRQCAGCNDARYCGTACQIKDWHQGGHSQKCGKTV